MEWYYWVIIWLICGIIGGTEFYFDNNEKELLPITIFLSLFGPLMLMASIFITGLFNTRKFINYYKIYIIYFLPVASLLLLWFI